MVDEERIRELMEEDIDEEVFRHQLRDSIPPEENFSDAKHYHDASIRQGTWLTTPLWNDYGWKEILENHGATWQDLMKAFRWAQYDFEKWSAGRKSWSEAMDELIDQVVEEVSL